MRRIPLRWALPIFHLATDAIIVAIFVVTLRSAFPPVSYYPNARMMIDPRSPGLQEPFLLLVTANLPAGITTLIALSTTGHDIDIPYDSKAFLWAGLYESLAVTFWCLISRAPSAYWWCIASMFVRLTACSIGFSRLFWGAGPALQASFWLIAAIYSTAVALWWLKKRVRTRLRSAA
jgi:hypothetical protein